MTKKASAKNIKKALLKKEHSEKIPKKNYVSSGSWLIDLGCSDYAGGAFKPGCAYLIVGVSGGGKTALLNTILAQACLNPFYDNYDLYNDDAENGNQFNVDNLFSPEIAQRIQPPKEDKQGNPIYSTTPQEFFATLRGKMKKGPCIYFLDSMDAIMDQDEKEILEAKLDAIEGEGKETKGSYGAQKAKFNYAGYRLMLDLMRKTGSIVFIIAHSKDAIGAMPFQKQKTRTGGAAMKFFASQELWTTVVETLTNTHKKLKRKVGIRIRVDIEKNRTTGKQRSVEVPIYYSTGIDNTGSCVDFLLDSGHWKRHDGKILAPEFKAAEHYENLIQHIESKSRRLDRLKKIVSKVWKKVEESVAVHRKNPYRR